ncbi:hypothetical protein [Nocardioides marmoribigeumensis]|uniref:Uncharacterized protein n=1 Tax=Nocardioides marmoribigeumensis TaxID=433649 RepID=A0ABU2BTJ1_9ACTN|nr:hypothetical protein [Nocardioides marmoribigeumensis]MDR7361334.1 hypothetical protein [Nocardioides marmoribigeumensis]
MKATIALIPLLLLSTLLTSARSADATPTGSLPAFCQTAGASRWQGLGVGPGATDVWETPGNWTNGVPVDGDACIPAGGVPRIRGGEEEHLRTLDVAGGATLTVEQGGKLFLFGDQASGQDSVVRSGGSLDVVGATLGGIARLHVLGRLGLTSNGPGAASTLLTRECTYFPGAGNPYPGEEGCSSPPAALDNDPFRVEVDDRGTVDVKGGGVNLGDGTTTVVRGLLRVRSGAYLAADHGTRLELRPHRTSAAGTGTLRFEGDGGYLEGKIQSDTGVAALSTLVDQGLVIKTGGTGRTLVSAVYFQPTPGRVTVRTGTLLLPRATATPATVGAGTTYGTGRCVRATTTCGTQTTSDPDPDRRQSADFRLPSTDTSGADVVVRRVGSRASSDLGYPFDVHATSMSATVSRPAVIRMRFDATVLGGKRWPDVRILRRATGATSYRLVKACLSDGKPPRGEVACVDRRNVKGVSSRNIANTSGNPDVLMVIRTRATSRWVGR